MAISTGTAILGSALIGGATGLLGANAATSAANTQAQATLQAQREVLKSQEKARELQIKFAEDAAHNQRDQLDIALGRLSENYGRAYDEYTPYAEFGTNALSRLSTIYGFGGGSPNWLALLDTPEYRFAFDQGKRATENAATARGNFLSPNTVMDLTKFGQGLAFQNFGNTHNRLAQLAGMGQNAAGARSNLLAQLGMTTGNWRLDTERGIGNQMLGMSANVGSQGVQAGNQLANLSLAHGQANAAGTVGAANALTGAGNSMANNLALYGLLNRNQSSFANNNALSSVSPFGGGVMGFA
jgi:hypothetical protein